MNTRERFVKTLTGEKVDRVPFIKVFGGANAAHPEWETECPGISQTIDAVLGFEGTYRGWGVTPVNIDPINFAPQRVIEDSGDFILRDRGDGTVEQIYKSGDFNRHTVAWPVKDRRTWETYKERHLRPDFKTRFPANWQELAGGYKNREYPLQLTHRGVYGFARERMGDEALCLAFYDDPDLVHELMNSYTDLAIAIWERQVEDVQFDLIECWEDMASKNGSLISPEIFRSFMTPCYEKIAGFAKSHGIKIILVDSDGYIDKLAELMLEAGVTAMYPFEVQAGCDVAAALDRYPRLGVIGGLNKEAMAYGKEAIDREMAKARLLIRKGRFIPGPDHFVLKNVTFSSYRYFMEQLREVVMTTTPAVEG